MDGELKNITPENFQDYDVVYLGYPIWRGVAAWPVKVFVEMNNLTDKVIIPFSTSGSTGLGRSDEILARKSGTGIWSRGTDFQQSTITESGVVEWIEKQK